MLEGAAKIYVRVQKDIKSWGNLKKSLKVEFGPEVSIIDIYRKLSSKRKKSDETLIEYLYKIIEIANAAKFI